MRNFSILPCLRRFVRPFLLIVAMATTGASTSVVANSEEFVGTGSELIDGDTLLVARETINGLRFIHVRLWGIDAPEKKQAFYTESSRSIGSITYGQQVRVSVISRDRRDHLVARVRCNGLDLSTAQVKRGMAWWFSADAPKDRELSSLEKRARANRVGLWRDLGTATPPVAPWKWRSKQARLRKQAKSGVNSGN